jgi:hypothetical protein
MKTLRLALLLIALAPSGASNDANAELAHDDSLRRAPADRRLVDTVIEETRVVTTPPTPDWRAYPVALANALLRWLRERTPSLSPLLTRFEGVARWLAWMVIVVAVTLILFLVARALAPYMRWRTAEREDDGSLISRSGESPGVAQTREGWMSVFERHLQRNDVSKALEAAWWLLAHSLLPDRVDPTWTSGDVLRRAERLDLAPLAAILDRMLYASRQPAIPDVRAFYDRLRAEVG